MQIISFTQINYFPIPQTNIILESRGIHDYDHCIVVNALDIAKLLSLDSLIGSEHDDNKTEAHCSG